jgi:Ca-activated chloride channel family protein
MEITHPLLLLVLVPLAWLMHRVSRARLRRLPWMRALAALLIRMLIAFLLVFALAGPRVSRAAAGVDVVFVLDRSGTLNPGAEQAAAAWVRSALVARTPNDQASIVSIGKQPAWSGQIAGKALPPLPQVDPSGTNIEAGLRLALAGLPANRSARIVLLSDGHQTDGDALLAAQVASARRVPISVVPIVSTPRGDVSVVDASVPATTKTGEHITVRIGLEADRAMSATVQLSLDGASLGRRTLSLNSGLNTFFFAQTVGSPGTHVFHVVAEAKGDPVPQNNSLDAVTTTQAAPAILLLTRDLSGASTLVQTLESAGFQVTTARAAGAPGTAQGLAPYSAVVLADVPASSLAPAAVSALHGAVHDQGTGLLVTGGPDSFAIGGYAGTPLEQLLPVNSIAEAHAGHGGVGLILVVDQSGSMSAMIHGVTKESMAQTAATEAIDHLQPNDSFGVISFDDTTHTIVPFGIVGNASKQAAAKKAIQKLYGFGNTVIYPALRQAARDLYSSKEPFKHVILITDGQGETNAPFTTLIAQMKSNGISLSTIAVGSDAETDELQNWATLGDGRFYATSDPHDIPRFVVLETRISSGPTVVQGDLGVRQAADDPALRSLVGTKLPNLHTYNIVTPKVNSQVLLQSQLGDPLLAQWRYGLGQVSVWTGGSTGDWAQSWLAKTAFWSDLVHGLLPDVSLQTLSPTLQVTGRGLQIDVDSLTPQGGFANLLTTRAVITSTSGYSNTIALTQDTPGHYTGTVPDLPEGVYRVTLEQFDNAALIRRTTAAVVVPYPVEYRVMQSDLDLLAAITAADGTAAINSPASAFNPTGLTRYSTHDDIWPTIALLALLLFPLDVAVRTLYSPPIPRDLPSEGAAVSGSMDGLRDKDEY